jgi:signal transduction histidine kinase
MKKQKQKIYLDLASTDLKNNRSRRYDGAGFSISLHDMAPEDVSLILRLYNSLKGIYDLWLYMGQTPNYELLRISLKQFSTTEFVMAARSIGVATYALDNPPPELRKACHDLRGGALSSLTGYAKLIPRLPEDDNLVRKAVFLARDHAKMMRNIIPDLDKPIRAADESVKLHSIHEFIDKWDQITVEIGSKQVKVLAESDLQCYITNRCLESSAIDRILYNYLNNAIRFSAKEYVHLVVIPIHNSLTRWVVENELTDRQKAWLQETLNNELSQLFQGGYTRGGQGIGLSSCSDLVAASFGISPSEAIESEYLGAKVNNHTYYAWFHWPIYVPTSENEHICNCTSSK